MESLALDVVSPPTVIGSVGTKVKSARGDIVSTLGVSVVVSTRLHDVNFTRAGPFAIDVVLGQHPNSRPQPVTSRKLGLNLNTAVFDGGTKLGVDAAGLNRIDDCAVGGVGGCDTVGPLRAGATVATQIKDVVVVNQAFILKSWLDDEDAILEENVLVSVGGLLKLAVANRLSVTEGDRKRARTYP